MKLNYGFDEIGELMEVLPQLLPFLIPLLLLQLVMLTVALINLLKKELPLKDKAIWLIIIICVQLIGPVVYFAVGSKMLDDKAEKERMKDDIRD